MSWSEDFDEILIANDLGSFLTIPTIVGIAFAD